jgi:hypothetical protein
MSADPMQNVTPHEEPKLSALPAPAEGGVPADIG